MSAFVRVFKVGPHRVTLTVELAGGSAMRCEWEPLPRRLSIKRIAEYQAKRNACLKALATEIGVPLFVATPGCDDFAAIEPDETP